jgi:hypothetical protein
MIDYETYCRLVQMHRDGLRVPQIGATLGLNPSFARYLVRH